MHVLLAGNIFLSSYRNPHIVGLSCRKHSCGEKMNMEINFS